MDKGIEALIARKGNAVTGSYYLAECGACGEMFTSERMTGGEAIADTGDYGDCYCPHCDTDDSEIIDCGAVNSAVVEAWNFQQKHIDALISALEQAQRANAAQDAHINQQADRIESLESKNSGLGKSLGSAHKRIAELESAPNGMMQLSNELAEMLVEKLPAPMNVKMGGDAKTKAMFSGMNMMLEDCKKVIRAAGSTVEGSE